MVLIHGTPVPEVSTEVEKEIIGNVHISRSSNSTSVEGNTDFPMVNTCEQLTFQLLSLQELKGLPINNCILERDLSKFDAEAAVSQCRN